MNTTIILGKDEDPSIINRFRKLNFKLMSFFNTISYDNINLSSMSIDVLNRIETILGNTDMLIIINLDMTTMPFSSFISLTKENTIIYIISNDDIICDVNKFAFINQIDDSNKDKSLDIILKDIESLE
jgi:hypothetical protein